MIKTDILEMNVNDNPNLSYKAIKTFGEIQKIEIILNGKILLRYNREVKNE